MVKAGTFLYSDRIQKENSKAPILKIIIINLENPGIINWKCMVLDLNAGFYFSWTELI